MPDPARDRRIGEGAAARAAAVAASVAIAVVLLVMPLAVVFTGAFGGGLTPMAQVLADPDARAAIWLTLTVAAFVVPLNTAFGLASAWCVSRYRFRGRVLLVALTELPFSVSPVISGMIYVLVFGLQGWLGPFLTAHGVRVIFALPGIVLSTMFVTLPFVARQVAPLMEAQGADEEEAALTLGAGGWQVFRRITLPKVRWALAYGVLLCNARSMGEFGAVSVVSGHIRGLTDTMPLHVEILYNEYNLPAAFAMSSLLAALALATIGVHAILEWRQRRGLDLGSRAVLTTAARTAPA